jgi:hypothetical protein
LTAPDPAETRGSGRSRLLWFVGLYAASLLAFTAIVYALRALIAIQ